MNDPTPLVRSEIDSLRKELESSIPDSWNRATLKVVMHYEEGSVGTSHILHPPDRPDDYIEVPVEVFQLTASIERKARAGGQAWRQMTVDGDRRAHGWDFEIGFVNKAA